MSRRACSGSVMKATVGRLHGRRVFRALARPDGRGASGPISVAFVDRAVAAPGGAFSQPLVGYAIGRPHGNAVRRNRLRRRLRAALRAGHGDLVPGAYLVRAAPAAADLGFEAMVHAVHAAVAAASQGAGGTGDRADGR